jgi:polyhydroxyalkanoate synthesis regulator phasin
MKRAITTAVALIGAGALVFGMGAVATADHRGGKAVAGAKAHGPINKLVTAGTITQAEADAFHAAMKAKATELRKATQAAHKAKRDQVLADLVAKGTITQVVADLIKAGGSALRDAVKAGTVTYAQLGAVKDAMQAAKPSSGAMQDLVKTVTDKLVAEGKLSAAGAAAIVAALPDRSAKAGKVKVGFGKGHGKKGHGMKGARF